VESDVATTRRCDKVCGQVSDVSGDAETDIMEGQRKEGKSGSWSSEVEMQCWQLRQAAGWWMAEVLGVSQK
jgi:hypothetical protein